ncbi:MAG TPA: PSD1 and planctomycete cytochrome C domain-containing protein [Pirellulales bacterium]|jgi:mono/diheme cytochrome c family protein|nr:PSD1 and planctomycete cytochrome C domain-containing protein [Pirellulales bacterium]
MHRFLRLSLVALWMLPGSGAIAAAAGKVDYASQIRPILAEHCFGCHGADKAKSDLRLDSIAGALAGGNSGPSIVPGKSGESLLIEAVTGGDNASPMPPEGPRLPAETIALLKTWIDQGAPGPREAVEPARPAVQSSHWSFQPLAHGPPPKVKHAQAVRTPIDAFIISRLEREGLTPSPEAEPAMLARRVYLDLIGLPPSPAELAEFLNDKRPDAYDRLVDRLLASPAYGERWARHWLDLARYADSNGYTIDGARSIWKYRDWVIAALNRDMPFDQFTVEQLAGDLLAKPTTDQLVATGFHRNTMRNEEGGTDPEQFRVEAVVDRVSTTGSVWLGLTVGCARCHDHKYDPISQREFYQLFAVFNNADEPSLSLPTDQQAREQPAIDAEIELVQTRVATVEAELPGRQAEWEMTIGQQLDELAAGGKTPDVLAVLAPLREALAVAPAKRSKAQKKQLLDEYRKHDKEYVTIMESLGELKQRKKQLASAVTTTLVMHERAQPRPTFVHLRGDFLHPGARVSPGVPAVLPPLKASGKQANRLDFARWLVGDKQPLTPRVTVNRIWQQYFGQGLVATENDFGTQGERPTHPELLDWLAGQFVEHGWSLKALHRMIVSSATYRQASTGRGDLAAKDPYNKLLGRQNRIRLDAEIIRDSALAASGLLDRTLGGPGVYPPQPEGIYRFTQQKKFWKENTGPDRYRRTMYTFLWRSSTYPLLTTFDAPDATVACTRRVRSNTPLQALTLANDRGLFEAAQALAARLMAEAGDDRARIELAAQLCLARNPSSAEQARLTTFLERQRAAFAANAKDAALAAPEHRPAKTNPAEAAAWTALARVMLNLDEFVTRE